MAEWKEGKLGDFAAVKGGKRLPKGSNLISEPNSHPYIRIRDLGKEKVLNITNDFEYVDDITQEKISRYIVDAGDIIISIVGTIGLVGVVGKTLDKANFTENCVKLVDIQGMNKEFLYYYLISTIGQAEIAKRTVGAVQPKLPIKNIQDIRIRYPELDEQKKIGSILAKIDEKISINNRINNHLEQVAQTFFVSMFVTHADPDWKQGHLSDLITVKYGKDHKKLGDGCYPVYGSGGIMRYVERPLYDKESVLIPRKGTLNNVMYVNQPFWSVDTMFYTEMRLPNVAKFVYHFVKGKDLVSMNAGSAVPSMTTDILNAIEVIIPSAYTLEEFETIVSPIYQTMQENNIQSKKLSKLRDSLLPKLMSGELDVSNIDL